MELPRFRLTITSKVKDRVGKGESILTDIVLCDRGNVIGDEDPLASASVMMVVLNGEFNKDDIKYNWSKEDFQKSIRRPVSGGPFKLAGGSCSGIDAKITENSSNKKVRLGVMVVSQTEERVLEGLSNRFFVRDPPKKSKPALIDGSSTPENNIEQAIRSSTPRNSTHGAHLQCQQQTSSYTGGGHFPATTDNMMNPFPYGPNGFGGFAAASEHLSMLRPVQPLWDWPTGGVHSSTIGDRISGPLYSPTGFGGLEEYIIRPVQLLWDRPDVEPSKRWNLLDQLMPLYSRQPKVHSGDFPTMRLMPEHYDSLTTYPQGPYRRLFLMKMMRNLQITTIPKEVMQTHRNRGVLIQPLEPDDSDDEPLLKRKLHNKYQLRFVNKVCEAYYTWEQIKADDGNLLNVALYDENNSKITSGPLSSASVEVVVLHGDFNANGQDYWTSEEFSSCVVCPQSGKGRSALGGDRVLVLVDGEACVGFAFFQKTSSFARTGKFKMGVKMKITLEERIQEGISESFFVTSRRGKASTVQPYQNFAHAFGRRNKPGNGEKRIREENAISQNKAFEAIENAIQKHLYPIHRSLESLVESCNKRIDVLSHDVEQIKHSIPNCFAYEHYSSEANQEHTAAVKVANQEQTAAVDGSTMSEACEDAAVQLRFLNCSKPLVYTERKITAEGGMAIKIAIFRDNQIITSGPLSSARIEILALHGDFFDVVPDNWTEYEFDGRIVSSRQGPVLGGDCQLKLKNGVVSLVDICFKKVSSKTDSGKLILAARVHSSDKAGLRVKEAVMNPVEVLVSRNELNAKSNRPKLKDLVCRLRGISGNGTPFKMLQENGISTVEDFRKALNKNEEKIRNEYFKLKKDNKLWEAIVKHAEECDLEGNCKLKSYIVEEQSIVLFFNCVYDLVGAKFHGCYITKDNFNSAQQDVVNRLKEHAYDKLDSIQFDHEIKENYPIPLSTTTNTSIGDSSISKEFLDPMTSIDVSQFFNKVLYEYYEEGQGSIELNEDDYFEDHTN